jgi:hypothetical protein
MIKTLIAMIREFVTPGVTSARRPLGGPKAPPAMGARRLGGEDGGLT